MKLSKKQKEKIFGEVYNGADVYYALTRSIVICSIGNVEREIQEAVEDGVNKGDK